MKNINIYLIFIMGFICIMVLGSCGDKMRNEMGFGKKSLDEYQVTANKPLSVPPNYELVPPSDVEDTNVNSDNSVHEENLYSIEDLTKGEKALLILSNADKSNSSIRKDLEAEESIISVEKSLLDKILAGETLINVDGDDLNTDVLDAQKERERISKKRQEDNKKAPTITREK